MFILSLLNQSNSSAVLSCTSVHFCFFPMTDVIGSSTSSNLMILLCCSNSMRWRPDDSSWTWHSKITDLNCQLCFYSSVHFKISFLSADDSRRAHRECLDNGRWRQRENSSDPWRDDSECKEDHYFKDKVRRRVWPFLLTKCVRLWFVVFNFHWFLDNCPRRSVFISTVWWSFVPSPFPSVCPGGWNASTDSPQAYLCHWLFPLPVFSHNSHSRDGHIEVRWLEMFLLAMQTEQFVFLFTI